MLTIIVCAAIGFFATLLFRKRDKLEYALITGFFSGIAGLLIAMIGSSLAPRHEVLYDPFTLVSMRTSDGSSGAFVWGSGTINSEVSYNFLYKNDDGSLTPGQVTADSHVRIIEDPKLKDVGYWSTTMEEYDQSWPYRAWVLQIKHDVTLKQEFRVPAGSVVQSISIK